MRLYVIASTIAIFAFGIASASAGNDLLNCMVHTLRDLAKESRNAPLTPEQIQSIHNHYTLEQTPEGKQKAFQIILDHELALLKPEQAERVRALEKDYFIRNSKTLNGEFSLIFSGESKQATRRVIVEIPKRYKGTALEHILKFHEFFHSIQYEKIRKLAKNDLELEHLLSNLDARYALEQGAIQGEWKFVKAIPLSVRKELIAELSNDRKLSDSEREFGIRLLNGDDKKLSAYLLHAYHSGRYSEASIVAHDERLLRQTVKRVAGIVSSAGAYLYIDSTCTSQVDDHGNHPNTKFFNEICLKAPITSESVKALITLRKPKS